MAASCFGKPLGSQAKRQSERTEAVQNRFRGSEVAVWQTLENRLAAFEPGFVLPQLGSWPRPRTSISLRG